MAGQVGCELEVAVDGDEIELELELKWSTSGRAPAEAAEEGAEEDESAEDASEEEYSEEGESGQDATAEGKSGGTESDQDAAESDEFAPVQAAEPGLPSEPRSGRRRATSAAGKAFNGVDNAAVRAWTAANGLTVSPRGRIKEEMLKAYRDAGN